MRVCSRVTCASVTMNMIAMVLTQEMFVGIHAQETTYSGAVVTREMQCMKQVS